MIQDGKLISYNYATKAAAQSNRKHFLAIPNTFSMPDPRMFEAVMNAACAPKSH